MPGYAGLCWAGWPLHADRGQVERGPQARQLVQEGACRCVVGLALAAHKRRQGGAKHKGVELVLHRVTSALVLFLLVYIGFMVVSFMFLQTTLPKPDLPFQSDGRAMQVPGSQSLGLKDLTRLRLDLGHLQGEPCGIPKDLGPRKARPAISELSTAPREAKSPPGHRWRAPRPGVGRAPECLDAAKHQPTTEIPSQISTLQKLADTGPQKASKSKR